MDSNNQKFHAPTYEVSTPFIIALIVYGVVLAVSIILVLRRCHLQPLRFRDPYLLISTVLSQYVNTVVSSSIVAGRVTNCVLQELIEIPYLSLLVLVSARFWKLLLASHMTQARLAHDTNAWWILRHPWMASNSYLWRVCIGLIVVLALIQFSIAVNSPGCVWADAVYYFNAILIMMFWWLVTVMTWKLRSIQDGFFVVPELKMLGITFLITNLFLIIYVRDGSFDLTAQSFVLVMFFIQLLMQTWYPLWKSYQMQVPIEDPSSLSITIMSMGNTSNRAFYHVSRLCPNSKFIDILRHPDGFQAMKRFLTLEFSVENLLCWQQLNVILQERDPKTVSDSLTSIYRTFICDGSPNEVNISSGLKQSFHEIVMGQIKTSELNSKTIVPERDPHLDIDIVTKLRLLERLHHELVKLMQMDSFGRFKLTKEFQQLFQTDVLV